MALSDKIFGDPSSMSSRGLERAMRFGSNHLKIQVSRVLADQGATRQLGSLLHHPVPGVRRSAARGLGWARATQTIDLLRNQLPVEAADTVRLAIGGALMRLGQPESSVIAPVVHGPATRLWTIYGEKDANRAIGRHEGLILSQLQSEGAPTEAQSRVEDVEALDRWCRGEAESSGPEELESWATLGIAKFIERVEASRGSGRRVQHQLLALRGIHGCPSHLSTLRSALESFSDDPGMGFARRRIAAAAIGLIGNPDTLPVLITAADREAREFEGRPGSGLGIQYPVRNSLIWGMGEIGNPSAAPYLAELLDDVEGTATGGLYLPAMSALAKFGEEALPALTLAPQHSETRAVHTAWLLGRLGPSAEKSKALNHSRPAIRAACELGEASRQGHAL